MNCEGSLALNIGVILAIFISLGTVPFWRERFIMCVSGCEMIGKMCFRVRKVILSYPGDVGLRVSMIDCISSVVVGERKREGNVLVVFMKLTGLGRFCGNFDIRFGPILVKYLLNSSAIVFLSAVTVPFISNSICFLVIGLCPMISLMIFHEVFS